MRNNILVSLIWGPVLGLSLWGAGLLYGTMHVHAQHNCAAPGTKAAEWVAQYKAGGAPRIEWKSTSGVRVKIAVDGCLVIIHAENPIILEPPEAASLGAWLSEWYGKR